MRMSGGRKRGKSLRLDGNAMKMMMEELEGLEVASNEGEWTRTCSGDNSDEIMIKIGFV